MPLPLSRAPLLPAAFLILTFAGIFPEAGVGCQICIPYPGKSIADHLIENPLAILAREDPDRPFHFRVVETLRGDSADEPPIELFLDSSTRRLLSAHPDRSVLLVKGTGETGEVASWRRICVVDEAVDPVIREILGLTETWAKDPAARFPYFADRLNHENETIRTLARLEVARAPYRDIRQLRDVIPREEIRAFLSQLRYIEWQPLYILLLANGATEEDRERIEERVRSSAKHGSTLNLAAWATAFIELEGDRAIEFLESAYLGETPRDPKEIAALVGALAVHGNAGDETRRDRIVDSFRRVLEKHPDQAPAIVSRMTAWKRRDLAGEIGRLAGARPPLFDLTTLLKLRAYARTGPGL